MAKIRNLKDLPGWFDLKKYKGVESFRAFEWTRQLERRFDLLKHYPGNRAFHDAPEHLQDAICVIWRQLNQEAASHLWDNPIQAQPEDMPNKWISDVPCLPIKPVCVSDLAWQMARDKNALIAGKVKKSQYTRWAVINPEIQQLPINAVVTNNVLNKSSAIPPLRGVIPRDHTTPLAIDYFNGAPALPIVQVNLSAPDTVLKEAFAAWLKEARDKQVSAPQGKNKMYDRWQRYGLLPYLDLRIWELMTGNSITRHVMSEAVDHVNGESSFSKTVIPLATGLMRDLSELQALAAVEDKNLASVTSETFER